MDMRLLEDRFSTIYQEDLWTHGSGPGSLPVHTIEYRAFLERFISQNAITSVTDLGCGDWQSSRLINWKDVHYVGLDVVSWIIDRNNAEFGSQTIEFRHLMNLDDLPGGDLCICKEVMQHLPNEIVQLHLDLIAERYRFALITNYVEPESECNIDIDVGGSRPLRLDRAPFNAKGCYIFSYYPQSGSWIFKNQVFLLWGRRQ
jgi:hypothetical protein